MRGQPRACASAGRSAREARRLPHGEDDRYDRPPEVLDAQPACEVCERFFEGGGSVDPRELYRSLGGRAAIHFALWREGWSATENLSVFFPAAALVLDPRARTLSVSRTPNGMLVVGVTGDTTARFDRAVRWPRGPLDPRRQLWVQVVLPPGYGYPNLYDVREGKDVTVAYPLAVATGFRGARLVAFGLNTSLAYERAYHVGTSRLGLRFKTRSTPTSFLRRSWTFHSVNQAERAFFLDSVRRTPAQLRALFADLDGAVDVVRGSEACLSADACEEQHGERASVGLVASATREVIVHELGHVVFDLALDERGRRAFRSAFVRTGWSNARFIPGSEQFADQLEHWALGGEIHRPEMAGTGRALAPATRARELSPAPRGWPARPLTYSEFEAEVAELADAPDSKSGAREGVWVRVPPSASRHGSRRIRLRRRASPAEGTPASGCSQLRRRGLAGETWIPPRQTSRAHATSLVAERAEKADTSRLHREGASSTKEGLLRKKPLLAIVPIAVAAVGLSVAGAASGKTGPTAAERLPSSSCGPIFYKGSGSPQYLIASDLPLQGAGRAQPLSMVKAIQYVWRSSTSSGPARSGSATSRATTRRLSRVAGRPRSARRTHVRTPTTGRCSACWGRSTPGCAKLEIPILNRAPGGPVAMISLREHVGRSDARRAVERPGRAEHLLPDEDPQLRAGRDVGRLPGPVRGRSAEEDQEDERLHPSRQPDVREGCRQRVPVEGEQDQPQRRGLRALGREGRELRGDR